MFRSINGNGGAEVVTGLEEETLDYFLYCKYILDITKPVPDIMFNRTSLIKSFRGFKKKVII